MKKILGLDLGTTSIGWALVNEAESGEEKSSIIKVGVRVNPLTVEEQGNFQKGKSITTNSGRTLKRTARRNLQRYKLRRDNLLEVMRKAGWINDSTVLAEQGPRTTFETLGLRAKAATEEISLEQFARVLLSINRKRGYKSSRKAKNSDEGSLIDGMAVARILYDNDITPGQFAYERICEGKYSIPDFYNSDLERELDLVWEKQKSYYPELLTDELRENLRGKNKSQVWKICESALGVSGKKRQKKGRELMFENYLWRSMALTEKLSLEDFTYVLQEISGQIASSSGYLGKISDRSKELYFAHETVGQYLVRNFTENPHFSSRNVVFYRQDYLDEFERIWETQKHFHNGMTPELKHEIRDIVIFYQRPLKSQKSLISICPFEQRTVNTVTDGVQKVRIVGPRVCPKSSPVYQEFKIWQILNNCRIDGEQIPMNARVSLFNELTWKGKISKSDVIKSVYGSTRRGMDLNFAELDGNSTMSSLLTCYLKMLENKGTDITGYDKLPSEKLLPLLKKQFTNNGWDAGLLEFNSLADNIEQQPLYRLWHLLYSYEGDKSQTGNKSLIAKLSEYFGFDEESARILAAASFTQDYGSLCVKAIRKILPYMKQEGQDYSTACASAGYRHSAKSLTREEIASRELKERMELLPKNTLRNPVVEKILNQMVNVVNAVIEEYGRPDEVRIELARELKKSAKEREQMTSAIAKSTKEYEEVEKILKEKLGVRNISHNDIIRYRLYQELKDNGYKALYSDRYIPFEQLFSKNIEIEHIIPQARLFDDSFSNKTLEYSDVNKEKGNTTAMDYVLQKYGEAGAETYRHKIEKLFDANAIGRTKMKHLLMRETDIPDGFINRDLRDSQYIAKKAKEMLEDVVRYVVTTTGSVTDRLREDWQLVNVMQELNWDKYDALGMTEIREDKDGRRIRRIKNWTKRNDHRHHAMDALTIAFTKRSYIQYLNYLNARLQKSGEADEQTINLEDYVLEDLSNVEPVRLNAIVRTIENSQLYWDGGKRRFCPPMPLDEFRAEARHHLEAALVSVKAKNKVVTRNVNVTKKSGGVNKTVQLTPRGQLHNETVYGKVRHYATSDEKVGSGFTEEKILTVAKKSYREALLKRLYEFDGDPKKAFCGKNSLDKNPVYVNDSHSEQVPPKVKIVNFSESYAARKEIGKDLKVEKVVDSGIRSILKARLDEYGGDPTKAFTNLEENPIWLNKEKGISIKRVTITRVSNATPLHDRHDNVGNNLVDENDNIIPSDYVSLNNNHHVAIYTDADGNYHENVVSFFEATARAIDGAPIVDREFNRELGWNFLFSMKRNEYFVFPNPKTGFDPNEIDLMNPENYPLISSNLFRVQKLSAMNYVFRHHLETNVEENLELKDITWKRIGAFASLKGIVKVRINHIGEIVAVGEY